MTESSWPQQVELADFVSDVSTYPIKVRIPAPIYLLVGDLLAGIPRRLGVKTSGELIAALVVKSLSDIDGLGDVVGDYRETKVHAVVLRTDKTEGAFKMPPRADVHLG